MSRARVFDGYVDAINATDGSGANCHMSSVAVCALLTRIGYSPVLQISCRDRNRIAIQGDILGGAAMGVANLLCLTGDGVQSGDHPQAKPVFDLDSISLLQIARRLRDEGRFESGRKLTSRPQMFLGAAENPFAPPYDWRPLRLAKKIAAGAQFIQTQYCFDVPAAAPLHDAARRARPPRQRSSSWSASGRCPRPRRRSGCAATSPASTSPMPWCSASPAPRSQRAEGRNLCVELIQEIREIKGVSGVHVMAYRQEESVAEVIQSSGVLNGRVPWYPGRDVKLKQEQPEKAAAL